MYSRNSKPAAGQNEWKFEKYDENLQLVASKDVTLESGYNLTQTFNNEDRMHSFFMNRKGKFTIVTIDAADFKTTTASGTLAGNGIIKEISVLGDYAFIKVYKKKTSFLYSINWKTGENKLIPIVVENIKSINISLLEFQVLEDANEIIIYAKVITSKRKNDIYVIRLNDQGEKEEIFNLTKNIDTNLIDISCSKMEEGKYIYTGTYSSKYTTTSEGLFFCQADNKKVDFINFYNFLNLKNFLTYLPEKTKKRIEKKKDKKEQKGGELKINYRIACHQVIEVEDGYLFLGESYYPTYRTETYTTTSTTNGVTTTSTQTRQVFDGYQYTHAVLCKFDKAGQLVWDQVFEMWSAYKPYYVKKFISIAEKNQESIKLVFASRNRINLKSFDYDGHIILDTKSDEIETTFEGDKTKTSFSDINYWYDNYFIAYGNQKIKNKDNEADTKKVRKVYFISKIKFE